MEEREKIQVLLSKEAVGALRFLAYAEHRDSKSQAAWMLERELERIGLIDLEPARDNTAPQVATDGN